MKMLVLQQDFADEDLLSSLERRYPGTFAWRRVQDKECLFLTVPSDRGGYLFIRVRSFCEGWQAKGL